MKKHLSLFVPLLALFLALSPQTARAQLNEYFTISGASNLQVKFVGSPGVDLKYSTNKSTWTPVSGSDQTVSIGSGTYYFKGDNPNGFSKDAGNYVQFITSLGTLQGNIMSLINSTSFSTEYSTIPGAYCFYKLFQGCGISSASALKIPATTLADYCYAYMFSNCTSLTTYVELPASIAKDYCYYYMFYECYKLYTYNSGYADQYNTNRYILPLEELAPHCCERMFSWTTGSENAVVRHKNVEIMATSLKDRKNTEIENCLAYMFKFDGSSATTNYFLFYTTLHFTEWGGTGSTAATYNWWGGAYGTVASRIKFYINNDLPHASGNKATKNDATAVATNFPKNNTINTQTNAYLTFKVNGGTWESDGTYQQDIKRFVSSYYTAKTIPADPYKAGYTFSGWYTAADGGTEVSTATILSQTTSQTYFAHYVLAASSTLTITTPEHGTLVVKDNGDNTISSGASLASGTTLTLTAIPATGYRFKGYTGDATSGTFTMPGENATIGVEFEEDLCEVTIASPSNGTLTASDGTNNYTSGNTYSFNRQTDAGKEITFTTTPASHYTFSSWTDASSLLTNKTSAPYTDGQVCTAKLTIGNSSPLTYTVGASFALSQYTITTSATNGTVTGGGTYEYGTVISLVPLGASHYTFLKWSDENTSNPRSVTVTGNASYTAVFEFNPSSVSSADAAATIYQAGTGAGGKTILYALPSVTVSGITYTPVDMGYGVAWADRNIGAANITDAGGYFYYGSTTPIYPGTAGSSSTYYSNIGSMSSGDNLPMSADAAYQIMGSNWRIPTSTEWNQLLNNGAYNNTTLSANFTAAQASRTGNGTITSKTDPSKSITLPAAGVIRNYTYTQMSTYMCYWSSTLATTSSNGSAIPYHLYIYNGKTLASGSGNALAWHSLPIRAIYSPDYPICTLTIISGAYTYIYLCEIGQKVTITATPNDRYVFNKWSEDNNTNAIRTFTVMEDATYTATFTDAPTYTLAWSSNGSTPTGGTAAGSYVAGTTITAPTTSKTGYTFSKWRDETNGVDFDGTMPANNVTYTAQWTATNYTITYNGLNDASNSNPASYTIESSTIVLANPSTRTGYTFTGWTDDDNSNAAVTQIAAGSTGNRHFTANWSTNTYNLSYEGLNGASNSNPEEYTVETATFALANPGTREGYTFTGWTCGGNPITQITLGSTGDKTITANWSANTYNLSYEGLNGATNSNPEEYTVETATFALANPGTREGYTFTGWTCGGNPITQITIGSTGDKTITANWSTNTHNVSWVTDGNALTGTYTNGTTAYGTTIVAPATPTKNATAQYTYTFNGWTPAVAATMPDNDVTYTATWTETKRQYTLTWDVNGGNALTGTYTNGTIDWGTDIVKPADPTKSGYTFGGWDANNDGKADEVAATMPTNDITYKALWTAASPNITLCENCDNDHYNTFKATYGGSAGVGVNVTYPRQFTASRWSTMCLPFSLDLATMIAHKMNGCVYEFKYATGNANVGSGVNLYFSNAKSIEAGKCYIVNANAELAAKTSFVFSGVIIDLSKDIVEALESEDDYDDLPGDNSQGTIELVGTLRNGTLQGSATGNKYMGLKENKIYYPNTTAPGSTIWAYRGIFRSSEILDKESMQKMRIIVDGEDRGELIIDADGDILAPSDAQSRKFIENGVLYIEREGVIYDAQGKRVDGM